MVDHGEDTTKDPTVGQRPCHPQLDAVTGRAVDCDEGRPSPVRRRSGPGPRTRHHRKQHRLVGAGFEFGARQQQRCADSRRYRRSERERLLPAYPRPETAQQFGNLTAAPSRSLLPHLLDYDAPSERGVALPDRRGSWPGTARRTCSPAVESFHANGLQASINRFPSTCRRLHAWRATAADRSRSWVSATRGSIRRDRPA